MYPKLWAILRLRLTWQKINFHQKITFSQGPVANKVLPSCGKQGKMFWKREFLVFHWSLCVSYCHQFQNQHLIGNSSSWIPHGGRYLYPKDNMQDLSVFAAASSRKEHHLEDSSTYLDLHMLCYQASEIDYLI